MVCFLLFLTIRLYGVSWKFFFMQLNENRQPGFSGWYKVRGLRTDGRGLHYIFFFLSYFLKDAY